MARSGGGATQFSISGGLTQIGFSELLKSRVQVTKVVLMVIISQFEKFQSNHYKSSFFEKYEGNYFRAFW